MKRTLIIALCFACLLVHANDPQYPVSSIPAELKLNMNAVIRENQLIFKILSRGKANEYVHKVITILNEKGKYFADESVDYGKLSKIKSISGSVYDGDGKLIKRLKGNEIRDVPAFDGFSLYSDNRAKLIDLTQGTYPYTIELEYETDYRFLFFIPPFYALPGGRVSSQHGYYEIQYPSELVPRYRQINTDQKATQVKTKDGLESISWDFGSLMPIKAEPFGIPEYDLVPKIIAAPNQFEYDGYAGVMSSWEEYGQWSLLLNKGRQELPEATKQKVKELTKNLTTTEQKVKVLYEYLQNRTRYVSIQEGIGGLQPFPASVVDETGYGDCKALSNYMVALLKEAGIRGNYTRIRAGEGAMDIVVDFPSQQSNHVIVAVPNGADTLWLECTSQTNPFGYQGKFTGDRKALMITENGGKIVNTIRYSAEQNKQSRKAEVFLEKTGNAKAKITTVYSGLQFENDGLDFALNFQPVDQKKWIEKYTDIPSFDVNSFSLDSKKDKIPSAIVNLDLTLNRYGTVSGKRLFLTPNLMNRWTFIPERVEKRESKVVLRGLSYIDSDTIRFRLPEDIYPEYLPEPIKLKSRFGEYEATFKVEQGSILYIRKMTSKSGEFPPDSYNELIEFYKGITKADNVKIVFLNKT